MAAFKRWVKGEMEGVYTLKVPLVVDVGAGPTWSAPTDPAHWPNVISVLLPRFGYHEGSAMTRAVVLAGLRWASKATLGTLLVMAAACDRRVVRALPH